MLTLWKPNALRRKENGSGAARTSEPGTALSVFDEFDRFFDRAFQDMAFPAIGWGSAGIAPLAADISETADEFRLALDMPGLDPKDIDVKLEGDTLTIRAERKMEHRQQSETFLRAERSYGVLQRSFVLPSSVDASKVDARYEHGVLHLSLPKREEAKPKAITVKVK